MGGGRFSGAGGGDQAMEGRQQPHHGDAAQAEGRRRPRRQQRTGAQPHLIQRARAAGIQHLALLALEEIEPQRHARHVGVHQQVDRSRCLVVRFGGVEDEAVILRADQSQTQPEGAVPLTV